MRNYVWRAMPAIALLGCVFVVKKTSVAAADAPIAFASLDARSQIKVEFDSQGCFHHTVQHFVFTNRSGMTFTVSRLAENKGTGAGRLSSNQMTQLDNLLKFYRINKREGCTTHDTIEVALVREGKVVKQETYKDSSCIVGFSLKDVPELRNRIPANELKLLENLITFNQLAYDLELKAKSAKSGAEAHAQARRK